MQEQKEPASLLERYGRAILRMENREWDETIAPKPEGFDDLPIDEKARIIDPYLHEAHFVVGQEYISYLRRIVDFHDTEEEWLESRKQAYVREQERRNMEHRELMHRLAIERPYQASNAVDHAWQRQNRKKHRNPEMTLLPSFIRKLFVKSLTRRTQPFSSS